MRLSIVPLTVTLTFLAAPAPPGEAAEADSLQAALPDSGASPPFRIELFPGEDPAPIPKQERRPGRDERHDVTLSLRGSAALRYNRVEGLAVEGGFSRELQRDRFDPAYRLTFGYAFAPQRWLYRIGLEQPAVVRHRVTLGAEAFRLTEPFFYDAEILGDGENTASAFFLHRDYRDWYETEGARAWIGLYPSPFFRATAGAVAREERALAVEADWALFRQESEFRANPAALEGDWRAWEVALCYDDRTRDDAGRLRARPLRRAVEHFHRAAWERADPALGGDLDAHRWTVDSRVYLRASHRHSLALRVLAGAGASNDGPLPPQHRFRIGGVGTLRGHAFHALEGNRVALASLEYGFGLFDRHDGLVVVDSGAAWDDGSLSRQRVAVDVGAGIRLGEALTVLAAKNVNDPDSEVKVNVRFQETF